MMHSRRTFLTIVPAVALGAAAQRAPAADDERRRGRDLRGLYGLTTGSFMRHLSVEPRPGKLVLLDLPKIMRDELDLKVLDLMTRTFASLDEAYCDRLRYAAEQAGRTITNLKMNLAGVDIASPDDALRRRSLQAYKQTIDVAARLGCRWARPATTDQRPDFDRLIAGLRELNDYAESKGLSLLVENNGWMKADPTALPRIAAAFDGAIGVQPDTGNWTEAARYEGIAKASPFSVSCDFKASQLGPNNEHPAYDLRRCFDAAWSGGFRGPWCFEAFDATLDGLLRIFVQLREMLTAWTAENERRDAAK
jgi:hypothetical protein